MRTTKGLPLSHCPHCGREGDAASDMTTNEVPDPGSLSVCIGCGALSMFGDDMKLRELTREERQKVRDDPEVLAEVRRHQRAVAMLSSRNPENQ